MNITKVGFLKRAQKGKLQPCIEKRTNHRIWENKKWEIRILDFIKVKQKNKAEVEVGWGTVS